MIFEETREKNLRQFQKCYLIIVQSIRSLCIKCLYGISGIVLLDILDSFAWILQRPTFEATDNSVSTILQLNK